MRFTIGNKIFTAFGLLFAVFLVFGVLIYNEANSIENQDKKQSAIKKLEYNLDESMIEIYEKFNLLGKAIRLKRPIEIVTDPSKCWTGRWIDESKKIYPELEKYFEEFDKHHITLHNNYKKIDTFLQKKSYAEAQKMHDETNDVVIRDLLRTYKSFDQSVIEMDKKVGTAQSLVDEIIKTLSVGLFVMFVLILLFYLFFKRSLIGPISNIAQIAKKISKGDVDQEIRYVSSDELGNLSDSFRDMIGYLNDSSQIAHAIGEGDLEIEIKKQSENDVLGKALINMAQNLKKIMAELTESTVVLNSAAGEILATTSQVASSSAETSSAVAETTSSIEEIKQTAKISSEKAIHTSESTKKAVAISEEGSGSLDKNMDGLAEIKEKMDSIAANIIRLSEQSQTIGNIVSTVEDIASQSNLLAVNASIEAVKAGEQGKGFSVVAQELKNLADQSKQGTAQVQKILSDIQQATNTLVMVAEQGGKAVDRGMAQAKSAKESMQTLKQSVVEAAQAGALIAASSEQEMAGMDQIADAMMSIQTSTEQNVQSIRQVEESAKNLNTLSQKLKSLMDQYSVGKIGR